MKANIYYNSRSKGLDYSGEGTYVLVREKDDKCICEHLCSDRNWAIHDFVTMHQSELKKYKITEIYSLGERVWKSRYTYHLENDYDGDSDTIARYMVVRDDGTVMERGLYEYEKKDALERYKRDESIREGRPV